jgi:putative peptidoglycan lipid II flippase
MRGKPLSLALAVLTTIQVAAGFASTAAILFVLGAGTEADALIAGQTLPIFIVSILGTALVNIMVPVLSSLDKSKLEAGLTWQLLLAAAVIFGSMTLILSATVSWWAGVLFPGFSSQMVALVESLTRVQLVGMFFAGLVAVLTAICRIKSWFVVAELVPAVLSIANLVAMLLLVPQYGVHMAAWLWTARYALHALILLPVAGRPRLGEWQLDLMLSVWHRLRPLLAGASIFKLTPVVDRFLASGAPAGGLALLNVATQACSAGATVLERSLIVPVIPQFAKAYSKSDIRGIQQVYRRRFAICFVTVSVVFACFAILKSPLLGLLVHSTWGASVDFEWLLRLLLMMAGTALGMTIGPLVVAVFYAVGDSSTPTIVGVVGFVVGVALKAVGFISFGLEGLTLASSIYYLGNLFVGVALLERRFAAEHRKAKA